jgi:ATP-dependent Lhr-like helicase
LNKGWESFSPGIKRWLYQQKWKSLRPIQEITAKVIPGATDDVLITAQTAGGKTEAAFLPVISELEKNPEPGYQVLCISPLKALINDQAGRLEDICSSCKVHFTPWHGDIASSRKSGSWKSPAGMLMITPESLEAILLKRHYQVNDRFNALRYVVIDEFHSFIGKERGMQLISQLSRIESLLRRSIPRIALSATIGDPVNSLKYLRPARKTPGIHINDAGSQMNLRLAVKSYLPPPSSDEIPMYSAPAMELYRSLRGGNHLVFANSRGVVEEVSDILRRLARRNGVPAEFFAHHGSLDKQEREYVEKRLKEGNKPTTAVATSTLELGVDIGHIESVNQIGPPSSVSSIRQRLGRSGRREGSQPTLRALLISGSRLQNPTALDQLYLGLIQTIAVIELMLERWVEPGNFEKRDISTLVQQIISMVAASDVTPKHIYSVLCRTGPWQAIEVEEFLSILKALGDGGVLAQLSDGKLVVGSHGERVVSDYQFYAAFETPEEYKLVAGGKVIGTLPSTTIIVPGQGIIFAGKRWLVAAVDPRAMIVTMIKGSAARAPEFGGEPALVSSEIRQKMLQLFRNDEIPRYLDVQSKSDLEEARLQYQIKEIDKQLVIRNSKYLLWFIWESDKVINALRLACILSDMPSDVCGPVLIVETNMPGEALISHVAKTLEDESLDEKLKLIQPVPLGKFDGLLKADKALMLSNMITELVDIDAGKSYLRSLGLV